MLRTNPHHHFTTCECLNKLEEIGESDPEVLHNDLHSFHYNLKKETELSVSARRIPIRPSGGGEAELGFGNGDEDEPWKIPKPTLEHHLQWLAQSSNT